MSAYVSQNRQKPSRLTLNRPAAGARVALLRLNMVDILSVYKSWAVDVGFSKKCGDEIEKPVRCLYMLVLSV